MRALTLTPMVADSLAVSDVPDPRPGPADLLVDGLAVGVCGTDRELAQGLYGWAPPRRERLVIGHESLGRPPASPTATLYRWRSGSRTHAGCDRCPHGTGAGS